MASKRNGRRNTKRNGTGTRRRFPDNGRQVEVERRKRAEEVLRESEERYRSLFASAPMAVFVCDRDGIIQHYNLRAAELWGREPVCGVERHCGSLKLWLPNGKRLPHAKSPIVEVLRTGAPARNVEVFIERPDGSRLRVLVNFAALKDPQGRISGAIASFVDITERRQTEAALQELSDELDKQLRNFNAVVASVPDFIYSFDLSGRFTFVNQPLLDLWQKTFDEAVGKNFHELDYPPALAAKLQRQIQQVIKTRRPLKDETPYTSAVGERQYEYIFVPLLSLGGEVEAVAGVTRDITERKQREAELRSLRRQTEHALEQRVKKRTVELLVANKELQKEIALRKRLESEILEISDREQRRLGQDLHDSLCQHLAATAFMTRALAERVKSAKTVESAEIEKIAVLINEGVTEARMVARGLHPVQVDSAGLPMALMSLVNQKNGTVPCRLEIDEEIRIHDPNVSQHLYRIAREAIINANKHAQAREIVVRMRSSGKQLELSVTDNGIGISKDARASTGLGGLHIMNYRARSIGARLEISSRKPRGTRVACYLPRK